MKKRKKYDNSGITTLSIRPPPIKPSVVESEVVVPVLWALLLAGSLGLVATLAAAALRQVLAVDWEWWLPLAAGGSVGLLVFAWRCTVAEGDRRALLLWPIEAALGRDLDRDGYIGEPEAIVEPEPDPRLIYVHDPHQERRRRNAGDFRHFLRLAYDGRHGTTWRQWDDVALPSGRRVTRPLWETWTERLQSAGLATRAYPTAELELVGGYRQALETLRELL